MLKKSEVFTMPGMEIKGRDLISGLPREIIVTDADIREALHDSIALLVEGAQEVIEHTPPEILSDIMRRGVYLTGGGALIAGLDELLHAKLNIPVHVAEDPLSAVARGAGIVLENSLEYQQVLVSEDDELSPR